MSEAEPVYGHLQFEKVVIYLTQILQASDGSAVFALTQHGDDTCLVLPTPVAKAMRAYARPVAPRQRRRHTGSPDEEGHHARQEEG